MKNALLSSSLALVLVASAAAAPAKIKGQPAAPQPPPAAGPEPTVNLAASFDVIDKLLAHAEVIVREGEQAAAAQSKQQGPLDETGCVKGLSMDALLRHEGAGYALPQGFVNEAGNEFWADIEQYYRCRAIALNDDRQCEPVKTVRDGVDAPGARQLYVKCHDYALLWRMHADLMTRSPNARQSCVRAMSQLIRKQIDGSKVAPFCDAAVAYTSDARATCARLDAIVGDKKFAERCEPSIRMLNGAPHCGGWDDRDSPMVCEDFEFLHKAAVANNERLCGNHAFCRVMLGAGPQACEAVAAKTKARFCSLAAKYGVFAIDAQAESSQISTLLFERDKVLKPLLDRAEDEIKRADPTAQRTGDDAMRQVDARQRLLVSLGERWARIRARVSSAPPKGRARPARPKKA